MSQTTSEPIVSTPATEPSGSASPTWPTTGPARPPVVWGGWVVHHDTAGVAAGLSLNAAPDGLTLTMVTPNLTLDLQPDQELPLAASLSFSGHLPVTLPVGIPLAGFRATVSGLLVRSRGTSVVLTFTVGHVADTVCWAPSPRPHVPQPPAPTDGTSPADVDDDDAPTGLADGILDLETSFDLPCFTPDRQIPAVTPDPMSDPPAAEPHPPLPIAIGIHVRRWTPDDAVLINISTIDLQVLLDS